jgi:hypothetical protein
MPTPHGSKIIMDSATIAPNAKDHSGLATSQFNGKGGRSAIHNEMATPTPESTLKSVPPSLAAWADTPPKGAHIMPASTHTPVVQDGGFADYVTGSGSASEIVKSGKFPKPGSWGK